MTIEQGLVESPPALVGALSVELISSSQKLQGNT
jgi:hypothetical protein